MQNAKKFNERITLGLVPGGDDLRQLKEMGYKTLIDLRDKDELFSGFVEKQARLLGLKYINIPIQRDAIAIEDVRRFYEQVYAKASAPLYVFSRLARKPLVFLLLFDAVANSQPIIKIYRQAAKLGFRLEGDMALQKFLFHLYKSGEFKQLVDDIRRSRTDLFDNDSPEVMGPLGSLDEEYDATVVEKLLVLTSAYAQNKDPVPLQEGLAELLNMLARHIS